MAEPIDIGDAIAEADGVASGWHEGYELIYDMEFAAMHEALRRVQAGEIIHPHTVALAKVDLADHHALPIAKSCPIFCLGYDEYAMDPDHADDCAWVEARRICGSVSEDTDSVDQT